MDLLIRTICYKKVFLWAIFAVQLILIATVILIFGSLNTNYFFEIDENVKFVKNNSVIGIPIGREPFRSNRISPTHKNGDFFKEFINTSLAGDSLCFRDGVESVDNSICKCKFDYHGKDCGQPEILWRAFMTSKIPLNLSSTRREPHKIIYFIRTTTISMETLKIQIMELNGIVDLFVLCELGSTTRDQSFHLNVTEFLKQLSGKISVLHDNKCTPKNVYKKFRRGVGLEKGITADDVVLFSESDEILNWRVVKYFKWYDNWPQPVRFRLKYTVYGYYWQHPLNTIIGSMACQIRILDETFKGDPIRMMSTGKTGMIIGDLNYVGGWFCQYCYQPLEIVKKLLHEEKNLFLNDNKVIDSKYIENLIGNGLYVDGKMELTRLHKFSGKCYAPDFVSSNLSWRYQHILTNVYATYDEYESE